MIEKQIEIATPDGGMGVFCCHPERNRPHPVVLFLMDAPGIREELRDMVRRLAAVGYYVLLPNLYYRFDVEELGDFIGDAGAPVRERMMGYADALTIAQVMRDVDALIAFADGDPAARAGPLGCVGYCMSGRYALSAAVDRPDRVAAAASIYGTRLVTDAPDSPHRRLAAARAELYVAFAEIDHYVPTETAEAFAHALCQNGAAAAEIETYSGVQHGFAFPQRPMYDKPAAERHWERLLALFGRTLGTAANSPQADPA